MTPPPPGAARAPIAKLYEGFFEAFAISGRKEGDYKAVPGRFSAVRVKPWKRRASGWRAFDSISPRRTIVAERKFRSCSHHMDAFQPEK